MRKSLIILALFALLGADSAAAREIIGRGDFLFYLDTAAFRGKAGRVLEEVSVRIPNNELKFVEAGDEFQSQVKLVVEIDDGTGVSVIHDEQVMTFTESSLEDSRTSLRFQTVMKRFQLEPGEYTLSYAIEDLNAQKLSVTGILQGKNNLSLVRHLPLSLPVIPEDEPSFSEAKFLWEVVEHEGRVEYHANPQRLYGLYKDECLVYMELYLPDEMAQSETFDFRSVFINDKGETVKESRLSLPNPFPSTTGGTGELRAYPVLVREDLSQFVAGMYTLYFSFGLDAHNLRQVRAGSFSVAWDIRTWEVPRREFMAEARFLLGDKEFEKFQEMDAGDQEVTLDKMWKAYDPTPETGVNEAYYTFLERLSYVNAHYAEEGSGVFSPRGELYMKYGPPEEVIVDVIPMNRETLTEAMEMVENRFHPMNFTSTSSKPYSRTATRNVLVDPRSLAGERKGDHRSYPFELWVYEAAGNPLLERHRTAEIDVGMRYLFVDREGYGRYKLETSSSIGNK